MRDLCRFIWWTIAGLFRSRAALEAENLVLRQQINVLRRTAPSRPAFRSIDRLIFTSLRWLLPNVREALAIVKPETVIRWQRAGFRAYWRWKSRPRGGRPKVPLEIRRLIRNMSLANALWGAPRIHGELLKLGIDIGQTGVAKYMARGRRGPSQRWRTFRLFTSRVRAMGIRFVANAVRRRSPHDPGSRTAASRSAVQHMGSARATSVR